MRRTPFLLSALCLFLFAATASAQAPPKVLVFDREEIKPGKFGEHTRESNNFVRTLAKAEEAGQPVPHRVGMTPLAGDTNEVAYLWFFDSLDAWARAQQDVERVLTTPGPVKTFYEDLSAPSRGREDFHASQHSMVGVLHTQLSYNAGRDVSRTRYLAVTGFRVKPGHTGDFMRVAAMYIGAMRKMKSDDHWAMYEVVGGSRDGLFLAVSPMESLAEMDKIVTSGEEFVKAMGDDLDDFEELVAKSMEPSDTTIYAVVPEMSHVPKRVLEADRAFWGRALPDDVAPASAMTPTAPRTQKSGMRRRTQR